MPIPDFIRWLSFREKFVLRARQISENLEWEKNGTRMATGIVERKREEYDAMHFCG